MAAKRPVGSPGWWEKPPKSKTGESEPVWTFRGYRLRPGDFTTAMVHFFRSQVQRADVWRQRLDTTTNWAVITTGAIISVAFTRGLGSHGVIVLNILLVTLFLFIEARRYRFYELWSSRVRLLETDFFASMLVPPFHPAADWAESLAENLLHPKFTISMAEAFGRRYRRNYMWIYVALAVAWMANVWLYPMPATSWHEFLDRASLGFVPGWAVLILGIVFNAVLAAVGLLTMGLQEASGEVLPRYAFPVTLGPPRGATESDDQPKDKQKGLRAFFRPSQQRQQLLAFIITDQADKISQRVLTEMNRGVTALHGTGMYTGEDHTVLLSGLTVTEVAQLRSVVSQIDPNAFVIVSPAHEILGAGFVPLRKDGPDNQ